MNADGFDRLLGALDPDRNRAAASYEVLRQKLVSFFRWRGALTPDELADDTLDRVADKLAQGVLPPASGVGAYAHGVAVRVLQEHWRAPQHRTASYEALPEQQQERVPDFETARLERARRASAEQRLVCSEGCLAKLPDDTRQLLIRYHAGGGAERIAARRELAEAMAIPLNALRIRVYRLRQAFVACVVTCERDSAIRQ